MRIVLIVHYFPPINSSGGKRAEALSKYLANWGHHVTVITTRKSLADGDFTELVPPGVELVELDNLGRDRSSQARGGRFETLYNEAPSLKRRIKNWVMETMGQLPEPRLPFAFSFVSPFLAARARGALRQADLVIGSNPPWPMLLAALFAKWRFSKPCILDYRDHFSDCHEMPGSPPAKWLEKVIDRRLVAAADQLVVISEPMSEYYSTLGDRVATILNGYDLELIDEARRDLGGVTSEFITIRYMGTVSPGRIPHHFLEALSILLTEAPHKLARLHVEFYGNAALIKQLLITNYPGLESYFRFFEILPYKESLRQIVSADYLLFSETSSKATLSAKGMLTTKLFEYIGAGRPILADISPETIAGELLARCGPHHIVSNTVEGFVTALESDEFYKPHPNVITRFSLDLSREAQAAQYLSLAKNVIQDSQ